MRKNNKKEKITLLSAQCERTKQMCTFVHKILFFSLREDVFGEIEFRGRSVIENFGFRQPRKPRKSLSLSELKETLTKELLLLKATYYSNTNEF